MQAWSNPPCQDAGLLAAQAPQYACLADPAACCWAISSRCCCPSTDTLACFSHTWQMWPLFCYRSRNDHPLPSCVTHVVISHQKVGRQRTTWSCQTWLVGCATLRHCLKKPQCDPLNRSKTSHALWGLEAYCYCWLPSKH